MRLASYNPVVLFKQSFGAPSYNNPVLPLILTIAYAGLASNIVVLCMKLWDVYVNNVPQEAVKIGDTINAFPASIIFLFYVISLIEIQLQQIVHIVTLELTSELGNEYENRIKELEDELRAKEETK